MSSKTTRVPKISVMGQSSFRGTILLETGAVPSVGSIPLTSVEAQPHVHYHLTAPEDSRDATLGKAAALVG